MSRLPYLLKAYRLDERGATSIEYGMIGLFVSILIVVGVTSIGTKIQSKWIGPLAGNL
jgi:pilus assembly protein Flp/PilA